MRNINNVDLKNKVPERYARALEFLQKNAKADPIALAAYVGTGAAPSKCAWYVKELGFKVDVVKDGRKVVAYVLKNAKAKAVEAIVAASVETPATEKAVAAVKPAKATNKKALPKVKTKAVKRKKVETAPKIVANPDMLPLAEIPLSDMPSGRGGVDGDFDDDEVPAFLLRA